MLAKTYMFFMSGHTLLSREASPPGPAILNFCVEVVPGAEALLGGKSMEAMMSPISLSGAAIFCLFVMFLILSLQILHISYFLYILFTCLNLFFTYLDIILHVIYMFVTYSSQILHHLLHFVGSQHNTF